MVSIQESKEKTESDNEINGDFDCIFGSDYEDKVDDDVVRSVSTKISKAKRSVAISSKRGKPKGVMIKKLVFIG